MVSAGDGAERNHQVSTPQADVVQSLNEESGSPANSSSKNNGIWAVKNPIILFKSDMLFGYAAFQNLRCRKSLQQRGQKTCRVFTSCVRSVW